MSHLTQVHIGEAYRLEPLSLRDDYSDKQEICYPNQLNRKAFNGNWKQNFSEAEPRISINTIPMASYLLGTFGSTVQDQVPTIRNRRRHDAIDAWW